MPRSPRCSRPDRPNPVSTPTKYSTPEELRRAKCAYTKAHRATPGGRASHVRLEIRRHKDRVAADPRYTLKKWLRRKYGISIQEYDDLFARQGFACAICKTTTPIRTKHGWHVDHDHSKKKGDPDFVRGILCHHCNTGAGGFRDDPVLMFAAALWYSK